MNASDIMVRKVITPHTTPQASVSLVGSNSLDKDISALPVVDDTGRVVGIISEADLMRREETRFGEDPTFVARSHDSSGNAC